MKGRQGSSAESSFRMPARGGLSDAALASACGKTIPDVIGPGLDVLFCGINPGLYSAAAGHHFARPGNRFWPALHRSGFTGRRVSPAEDGSLIDAGLGITNLVARATRSADELDPTEFVHGRRILARKAARFQPAIIAILGIGAYRLAFAKPGAQVGRQPERIATSSIWVLPNPSGRNAHASLDAIVNGFRSLREASRSTGRR